MKSIGFIDYYISEWHADNYPAWIKEQSAKMGFDYQVQYAWAKKDISEYNGKTTDEWCKEFNIEKCLTTKELCEKSDNIIILAPSNPEQHLSLVKETFPYAKGKRIYIDKTFAPNLEIAKEIYQLAKKYDIQFFSTSALRYADEIKDFANCDSATIMGGGSNFEEYIIHQVEMIIKTMGVNLSRVQTVDTKDGNLCTVEFDDGRIAKMNYSPDFGFSISLAKNEKTSDFNIKSNFFMTLMKKILLFFERGEIDFSKEQTLAVMALREGAIKSKNNNGKWIEL